MNADPSSLRAGGLRKRRTMRVALLLAAVAVVVWSVLIEPARLVRHDVEIASAHWPAGAAPIRLAVIADIHAGSPHIDETKLDRLVAMTNEARPDAVFLVGDYVIKHVIGGRFMPPETLAAKLAGLRSRYGTFAVLGNHDWWYDGERVRRALQSVGISVLENASARIDRGTDSVYVAGLADAWTRQQDFARAFGAVPEGAPLLAMVHEPDVFPWLPPRVAVTFAGHTHGGQVRLPLFGPPIVPSEYGQRFAAGHVVEDRRDLFVTTGVGTSIIPVRFGVPPEVAIVTVGPGR
jgi:uncharacterized protein